MSSIFDVMFSYISPIYTPRHDALDREDLPENVPNGPPPPLPPRSWAVDQDGAAPVGDLPVEPSQEVAQGESSQTSSTVLSKIGKWTHDNTGKLYGALFVILALGALGIGGALTYNYTSSWWANTALPWMQNHAGILMLGWGGTTLSVALLAAIYFGAKKIDERHQKEEAAAKLDALLQDMIENENAARDLNDAPVGYPTNVRRLEQDEALRGPGIGGDAQPSSSGSGEVEYL